MKSLKVTKGPNTLIYESILIKIYMNTNIMNMQTFHIIKHEVIEGHKRSLKVTKGH